MQIFGDRTVSRSSDRVSRSTYDYIIVGAGSAGSVVTSKLASLTNHSILLLEEGTWVLYPNIGPYIWDAYNWRRLLLNQEIEKNYFSTPQPFCNNRTLSLSRSKTFGGCSGHNAMVFSLGNRLDYDQWGPGWTWRDLEFAWREVLSTFNISVGNDPRFAAHNLFPPEMFMKIGMHIFFRSLTSNANISIF